MNAETEINAEVEDAPLKDVGTCASFRTHATSSKEGLDRFNENLILYEPYLKWSSSGDDTLFESQAQWLRDEIGTSARELGADNEFVYLDYADKNQKPLESYGHENVAKMRRAAAKYDPEGVFQYMLPGGFKLSKVC